MKKVKKIRALGHCVPHVWFVQAGICFPGPVH